MKLKILISFAVVILITTSIFVWINFNGPTLPFLNQKKSEEFLRCERLVQDIEAETSCDAKWKLFQTDFKNCESFAPTEPTQNQIETSSFRDIVFNIGKCFAPEAKTLPMPEDVQKAVEVYSRGLLFDDWMKEDHFNSYSAHFLIQRELDLLTASKNPNCFNEKTFENQLKKFATSSNAEDLRVLLFSDQVLDTQVMASDAGGFLSYKQWLEVFETNKTKYQLQYLKKAGANCHLITGWDQDYPWRAFCGEVVGTKGCYYLMTIYAGIAAVQDDFEQFKTNESKKEKSY